jgi:ABC-2 type transport system ATP-binding protein
LRKFDLPAHRDIKGLSRGMRTKLAMLLALCRGAELLMLDEPTSGLDPAMAEEMLQALVGHVAAEGSTVFFSSHQLAEVEQIADHVAIIDRGQTVVSGALDDLRAQYQRIQLVFEGNAPEITVHAPGSHRVRRHGRVITVLSSSGSDAVIDELRGYRPASFDVSPVSLKDIFLESVRTED